MQIINSTPIPVTVAVCGDVEGEPRTAILTAKATFRMESAGKVEVERDEPYGILDDDQSTDIGLLPRDNLPKVDPKFEVLLLGRAYAAGGNPVEQMKVALSVGSVRRELDVIGDRFWEGEGDNARPSRPEPFREMPLVYERAYGGRAEVLIDVESPVEVSDPINPDGKGFDHIGPAREIGKVMKVPEGFPQYQERRELPNLEDPSNRILNWSDSPIPACWSTPPLHCGIIVERLKRTKAANPDRELRLGEAVMLHRAHPDWVFETPPAGAEVVLEGVDPNGKLAFNLPERRVVCDLQIGEESSSLELIPRMLVLLPEDRKFYIVYRSFFQFPYNAEETRVVRVREEDGWTTPSGAK